MTKRFDPSERAHEQRTVRADFRADTEQEGRITARVLTYGTVDSYGTTFAKGVFNASMLERMPRIVANHDWSDVIGVWQSFQEDDGGLTLTGQLDDFDAVPNARKAWAQLQSGSIDQFSVGFWPEEAREVVKDGDPVLEFTRGTLDEASLVMVGAVPGTRLVSLRSLKRDTLDTLAAEHEVDVETVAAIEAALLDAEAEEAATDDDGATPPEATGEQESEWTVEDVQAWALLADTGDEDAAEALSHIADEYQVDPDEWATWTEFVADALVEDDFTAVVSEDDDDVDAASTPEDAPDAATDDTDGADDAPADDAATLAAEIDAAFEVLDDLLD